MTDPAYPQSETSQKSSQGNELRQHLAAVFALMSGGMTLAGVLAGLSLTPHGMKVISSLAPFLWGLGPIVYGIAILLVDRMTTKAALVFYVFISAMIGMSLTLTLQTLTSTSIVQTFFVLATMFGSVALAGYTTRLNPAGRTTLLGMAALGLSLTVTANIISNALPSEIAVSTAILITFACLAIWSARNQSDLYKQVGRSTNRLIVYGAIDLFANLLNPFRLMASPRQRSQ